MGIMQCFVWSLVAGGAVAQNDALESSSGADAAAEKVIKAIQSREGAISTLSAVVVRHYGPGDDWAKYQAASQESRGAVSRFFGKASQPQQTPNLPPVVTQKTRLQAQAIIGTRRLDVFGADDAPIQSLFFEEGVWQTVYGGVERLSAGSRVILESQPQQESDVLLALGLCGSLARLSLSAATPHEQSSVLLSAYLQRILTAGLVLQVKELKDAGFENHVQITFIEPTTVVLKDIRTGAPVGSAGDSDLQKWAQTSLCHQVSLILDPVKGFVPRRANGRLVGSSPKGWTEAVPPQRWSVDWTEFEEQEQEIWLPRHVVVDYRTGVILPNEGEFKAKSAEDGQPLLAQGMEIPDLEQSQSTLYATTRVVYEISDVKVNEPLDDPLFPREFVAGTVVEDRRSKEVFQLTGLSPAIGAKLTRLVSQGSSSATAGPANWVWMVIVNFVVLAFFVAMFMRNRRREERPAK